MSSPRLSNLKLPQNRKESKDDQSTHKAFFLKTSTSNEESR